MTQKTCEERVDEALEQTMNDLRLLWAAYNGADCPRCENGYLYTNEDTEEECVYCEGTGRMPEEVPDLGNIYEYGLSFDYVPHDTFNNQPQGYFRYQLSWGGPSDEFRFYVDVDYYPYNIEYWFMDWFDGAMRHPEGEDLELVKDIFGWFYEIGVTKSVLEETII